MKKAKIIEIICKEAKKIKMWAKLKIIKKQSIEYVNKKF